MKWFSFFFWAALGGAIVALLMRVLPFSFEDSDDDHDYYNYR